MHCVVGLNGLLKGGGKKKTDKPVFQYQYCNADILYGRFYGNSTYYRCRQSAQPRYSQRQDKAQVRDECAPYNELPGR